MQKIFVIFLFLTSTGIVSAQELTWNTNLEKAIELSNKNHKPLMLFFTGSDWCGWCKRLQAEVFVKPEFSEWAAKNVVLVEVDFPRRTQLTPELQNQNGQLQQFFQVQGYPTVWLVNASKTDGKINFEKLGSTGYVAGGPQAWLATANQILSNK
jgi:protein disulfide-isomerase